MIEFYRRARKAVRGAAVAVLPWAYVVVESAPRRITAGEWLGLVGLVLGVGGTVYATRNYAPIRGGGIQDDGAVEPGSMALGLVAGLLAGWFFFSSYR